MQGPQFNYTIDIKGNINPIHFIRGHIPPTCKMLCFFCTHKHECDRYLFEKIDMDN